MEYSLKLLHFTNGLSCEHALRPCCIATAHAVARQQKRRIGDHMFL